MRMVTLGMAHLRENILGLTPHTPGGKFINLPGKFNKLQGEGQRNGAAAELQVEVSSLVWRGGHVKSYLFG